jgi:hypothetical protein
MDQRPDHEAVPLGPITLASGLEIPDPRSTIREFVQEWYPMYDGVPVPHDNELRVPEIALSTMLNSRISGNTAGAVWQARRPVEEALPGIPDANLLAVEPDELLPGAEGLRAAVDAVCSVKWAKLAVATKILHKKRPGLVPIFDGYVERQYKRAVPQEERWRRAGWGRYCLALTRLVHRDMLNARQTLVQLSTELADNGTPMTPCRILNALTWKTVDEAERQEGVEE